MSKLDTAWQEMKKRHAEELAKLQAEQSVVAINLLAKHFAERDEMKKLLAEENN